MCVFDFAGQLVPKYYYVAKEHMELERCSPGSQPKIASPEGTTDGVFLWGQSLYIIAQLLSEFMHICAGLFVFLKFLLAWLTQREISHGN